MPLSRLSISWKSQHTHKSLALQIALDRTQIALERNQIALDRTWIIEKTLKGFEGNNVRSNEDEIIEAVVQDWDVLKK